MTTKHALFVGRWQPFHNGHKWLIDQKLSLGVPVLLAVRDIPPDDSNPLTTDQTVIILETVYRDSDVRVIVVPDIESINYGRGVGYDVIEHVPPKNIGRVSATEIRQKIAVGDKSWRDMVHPSVQDLIKFYLTGEH